MTEVRVDWPGLLKEMLPSGATRYRVRVEGKKHKRIRLHITPEHKDFSEHYHAARAGIEIPPEHDPEDLTVKRSIAWLVVKHLSVLERLVSAGQMSPLTLKKRKGLLNRLKAEYGEFSMDMPAKKVVKIRDAMVATPAMADDMVDAIRMLFAWAIEQGLCDVNPAVGIAKIDKGRGGAVPWTTADLRQYRDFHGPASKAYLVLTLFMFTACRIGDAIHLGRRNEFERDGIWWLGWQPRKSGSAYVEIPMAPQLFNATRAATVQGQTYLLTEWGQPHSSPDSLGQLFRRYCREAGLDGRSSHGIRKAVGDLLANAGCSQHTIMAIHAHTKASTSEKYTRRVDRAKLAAEGMRHLAAIDW